VNAPRRQPPDVRREQILDAAQQVLLRRGPDAATMADVADAASLAKGTVYLYFASKAELLAGLRGRYFERLTAVLGDPASTRPAAPPTTAAARIEALVAASYDFALANHELHHALFHEAGLGEHGTFTRAREAVAELVAAGAASGELDVPDPALATDFVLHGLHGILVAASHRPSSHRRRLVDGVTRLVCGALGARPRRRIANGAE
jgi:TetR/AcrR family transcriptional repressor of nem operon